LIGNSNSLGVKMFRAWWQVGFDVARLGFEAQEVMSLRLAKLATGGRPANTETQRMFMEKGAAYFEACAALSSGASVDKVLRRYRSIVRANKRRLSR
jgi:hypothetical protein